MQSVHAQDFPMPRLPHAIAASVCKMTYIAVGKCTVARFGGNYVKLLCRTISISHMPLRSVAIIRLLRQHLLGNHSFPVSWHCASNIMNAPLATIRITFFHVISLICTNFHLFQLQQPLFTVNPTGISRQTASTADDPMARHDERNTIMPDCSANCSCWH